MRLAARYAILVVGIVSWIAALNALINRNTIAAVVFGTVSVGLYGFRRWRTPDAIQQTDSGLRIATNGKPVVVEFYADL